jgi:DNA-binding transcriptional MerR regulator
MSERGYTINELLAATGTSARTVRHWIARGLLDAPEMRGVATRYTEEQMLRARAIAALRRQNLKLAAIRKRLANASRDDLEALVAPVGTRPAPTVVPPPPPPPTFPAQSWYRLVLLPGLELHVDANGGPLLQRIAQAIYDHYGTRRAGA